MVGGNPGRSCGRVLHCVCLERTSTTSEMSTPKFQTGLLPGMEIQHCSHSVEGKPEAVGGETHRASKGGSGPLSLPTETYFCTALEDDPGRRLWISDLVSSLTSSSPSLFLSSLLNSASINVMNSCLEILPFLSVSIKSNSCLTSASPSATLSGDFGADAFCATIPPVVTIVSSPKASNPILCPFIAFTPTGTIGVSLVRKPLGICKKGIKPAR